MNIRVTLPANSRDAQKLKYALAFAKLGLFVAPLVPDTKLPYGNESWKKMRTRDPNVIRAWFIERPGMNYLISPGEKFVVLDLDTKNGKDGVGDLDVIASENDDFGGHRDTFEVHTPSGGVHRYFSVPHAVTNAHKLPPSIDVRGTDGYVVGPGCYTRENSITNTFEGEYEISQKLDLAFLPGWLMSRLTRWVPDSDRTSYEDSVEIIDGKAYVDGVELDTPDRVARATEWLQRGAKPAVEYEGGNQTTYNTFAWLREHAISTDLALKLVAEYYNPTRCVTKDGEPSPWTYEELERIRDNAYKYAKRPVSEAGGLLDRGLTEEQIVAQSQSVNMDAILAQPEPAQAGRWANDGLTLADARRRSGDTVVIVDMVMMGKGVVGILAETGSGKTVFLTTFAQSLAHDMDFLNFNTLRGYSVAYCMGEGHESALDHLEAFLVHYEVAEATNRLRVFENVPQLLEPDDVDGLARRIREVFPGTDKLVVIIDTWQRATAKAKSQSDDNEMVKAFEQAEKLSKDLGDALVIVALHPPKGDKNTASGAQQIVNQLENLLNLKKPDEVNKDRVKERKPKLGKDERHLFVQKLRAFGETEHYTIELQLKELSGAANAHGRKPTGRVAVRREGLLSAAQLSEEQRIAEATASANSLPEEIEAETLIAETPRQRNQRRERHKLMHAVVTLRRHIDDDIQATANAVATGRQAGRDMLTAEAAAEMLAGTKLKDDDGATFKMDERSGLLTKLKRWFGGRGHRMSDGRWLRFVDGVGKNGKRTRVLDAVDAAADDDSTVEATIIGDDTSHA